MATRTNQNTATITPAFRCRHRAIRCLLGGLFSFLLVLQAFGQEVETPPQPPYDHPLFTGPVQVAPVPTYGQEHLQLKLQFDLAEGSVLGEARLHLVTLTDSLPDLVLKASNMRVEDVLWQVSDTVQVPLAFELRPPDTLLVRLDALAAIYLPEPEPLPAQPDTLAVDSTGFEFQPDTLAVDRLGFEMEPDTLAADSLRFEIQPDTLTVDRTRVEVQPETLAVDRLRFEVQVNYTAQPRQGFHLEPSRRLWTHGKPTYNFQWFPALPSPGDRLTAEMMITVKPAITVFASGQPADSLEQENQALTYRFSQENPVAPFQLGMALGAYEVIADTLILVNGQQIILQNATYPEQQDAVDRSLEQSATALAYFSRMLNTAFPWENYAQVVAPEVPDAIAASSGMTVVDAHFLLDQRAVLPMHERYRLAEGVARQWFGGLVTAEFWYDIWLDEALPLYLATLFAGEEVDSLESSFLMALYAEYYETETALYQRPLVWDQWEHPSDLLDAHSRYKGAWVLHMIYQAVGRDAFWASLTHYLKAHAYGTAITEDFRASLEAVTHQPWSPFFDRWVYSAGHPVVKASYTYQSDTETLTLTLRQEQDGFLVPEFFETDLAIEAFTLSGSSRFTVHLEQREQTFTFPLSMQPRFVLIDPAETLLADITVAQPASAWVAQARYAEVPLARYRAIQALHSFIEDPALFIGLQSALRNEQTPRIRASIIETIGQLPPSTSIERTLLAAMDDSSAAVRTAAMRYLGNMEGSEAVAQRALEAANSDPSYPVQAMAVLTLARTGAPGALDIIRSALITPSYREVIRRAAFEAVPYVEMPTREQLQLALQYTGPRETPDVRLAALPLLGMLAPDQRNARRRLVRLLDDPSQRVRRAAIDVLGATGSTALLPDLKQRLLTEQDRTQARALQQAIIQIQTRGSE